MKMKFSDFRKYAINEAIKSSDMLKVANLIVTYLHKKLGNAYLYPSIEQFKHGSDVYTTITVLTSSTAYLHFNWLHGKIDQNLLHSVVISEMGQHREVKFSKDISLAQALPQIVKILQHTIKTSEFEFYLEDADVSNEYRLDESAKENPLEFIKNYVGTLNDGDKIATSYVGKEAGGLGYKLIRQLISDNPKAFNKNIIVNRSMINFHSIETAFANSKVKVSIVKDNTVETWIQPAGIDNKEVEEQISYIEKIEDLSNMLKFMVKGATNAVFVAGRGGCIHGSTEININERKMSLFEVEKICKDFNLIKELEVNILYKMPATMKVETPDGFKPVLGFIKKRGPEARVTLNNGAVIHGINSHLVSTTNGIRFIDNLMPNALINTTAGPVEIKSIELTDNKIDVFDLSVDSEDHLYVTANGVIHHNTGKTQTVEDTLQELGMTDGSGYFKVTGSASPAAIYETLFKNKKGVILFDDCDGALDTQDGRNLIKAATDTKNVRKVSWLKKSKAYYDPDHEAEPEDGEDDDIGDRLPRYFDFSGKIIFISNLSMRKLDPDGALKTRGMMIELNPTNHEMYQFMELIYNKVRLSGTNELSKEKRHEVVLALRDIIKNKEEGTINLRLLVRALNLAATGLSDWQRMLRYA